MKLITVMIGSVVILRKSYAWIEYIAAALLVGSACLFSLGDIAVAPEYSTAGIVIVLISLVADALHSNTQESVLKEQKAPESEVMLFTNMFAALYAL
jgi:drug/metabolite transporter (DMT)-like permease